MAQFYLASTRPATGGYAKCVSFCVVLATAAVIVSATGSAQERDRTQVLQAYKQIDRTCGSFTQRFCPALEQQASPSARNQAICLKSFKTSLSLPCRAAVSAATG